MNIGKEIAFEAKKQGICKEWFADMLKCGDIKPLCKMFFQGSDWAMEHKFPSLEILRKFVGISEKHGIFTDFIGEINGDKIAIFGESKVKINSENHDVKEIYLRDETTAYLHAKDKSYTVVNVHDNAKINIKCDDNSKVAVFCYGSLGNISFEGQGIVTTTMAGF